SATDYDIRLDAAQDSSLSFASSTVTNSNWNSDHRNANQTAYHAGQCAFHAGTYHDYSRPRQRSAIGQQAMNSGDPYVVQTLDVITHQLGRDDCFFGNRNVAGSCRNHSNGSFAIFFSFTPQDDCPCEFSVFGFGR